MTFWNSSPYIENKIIVRYDMTGGRADPPMDDKDSSTQLFRYTKTGVPDRARKHGKISCVDLRVILSCFRVRTMFILNILRLPTFERTN